MSTTQHSKLKTLSVDTCTFMNEILEDINDSSTSAGAIKVEIQRKFQLCKNTKHYQVQPSVLMISSQKVVVTGRGYY